MSIKTIEDKAQLRIGITRMSQEISKRLGQSLDQKPHGVYPDHKFDDKIGIVSKTYKYDVLEKSIRRIKWKQQQHK